VADELIGKAQAVAVQDAVLVQHHGVVQPAPQREAAVAQILDLVHEAESARACDLLQVRGLGKVDRDRLRGALDDRMAELDGKGQSIAVVGVQPRPLVCVLDFHAAHDPQEFLGRRLLLDAGLLDQQRERRGAAVHDRQFGRVQVDIGIVHAQAAERGHEVLHGMDLHPAADERRGEARLADQLGPRRNIHRRGKVDAPEHHAGVDRSRTQAHADLLAGVQADAGGTDQRLQGALPEHDWVLEGTSHFTPSVGLLSQEGRNVVFVDA
jgi:hypothetical protein